MKLQNLAVIFIIIILPIVMVLDTYMDNLSKVIKKESLYDSTLMDATYDAVRAYQMNTLNNSYASINTSKERDVKASLNSFFNSLGNGLGKSGIGKNELNTSIPAVLFTLYDGYYIYAPYQNVAKIDNGKIKFSENNNNIQIEYGLKPYNYYSCQYKGQYKDGSQYDITINYTLDNYISVVGKAQGGYITASGYYIKTDGISVNESYKTVTLNNYGVTITPEELGEYQAVYDTYRDGQSTKKTKVNEPKYYRYINYNRVKYYYDPDAKENNKDNNPYKSTTYDKIPIFYLENNLRIYLSNNINNSGSLINQIAEYIGCNANELTENNFTLEKFKDTNAYHYYKDAKTFSDKVNPILKEINIEKAVSKSYTTEYTTKISTTSDNADNSHSKYIQAYSNKEVFNTSNTDTENDPELESSPFNAHRMDVIISSIESNLTTTIANLNNIISSDYSYRMPTLSETDWYKIANNVTTLSFMQGLPIGNYKFYNNYSLVVNTKNREFISKNAIYLQNNNWNKSNADNFYTNSANGQNYHDPRCTKLNTENKTSTTGTLIGYINSDYEIQSIIDSYNEKEQVINYYMQPHTAGYECIITKNDNLFSIDNILKGENKNDYNGNTYSVSKEVQRAYTTALAREKGASYKNFANLNL